MSYRTGLRGAALAVSMLVAPCGTLVGDEFAGREKLRAQSDEFRKDVIRVTEGVYVATGYSASNVTLIQGESGAIIVDTGSDPVAAREVRAAFGNLLEAPVRAIVYTHGHPDHTGGASVFAGNDNPDIYSHQLLVEGPPDIIRGMRDGGDQFGMRLPDSLYINAGIQLQYGRLTPPTREGYVRPTRTFSGDQLSLAIAGVRSQLLHTPGETRENVAVWLPDKRVLMTGDDFYRAFPNLYPIRGGRLRPPEPWIASLETMLALGAEHLVPGHTRPITGAANVRAALTAYRDAIRSVLDQTLAGMRQGERPDELLQHVELPPPLADSPYLQEFYGSVAWSVRAIYADRLGWFDGNATRLFPLTEQQRAAKIIGLAGGAEQVLARARDAVAAREFQWAAELGDYVLAVDGVNGDAKRIKGEALTELGERQINANARNYYLSSAQYLLQGATTGAPTESKKQVTALAPRDIRWFTPADYTDGRQRAHLRGDSSKGGDWIDRVRIPGGSRVLAHTHPDDEVVTVIEGTWLLGIGERFDEKGLKAYPAGSFVFIPAHVPHFLAAREGPVIVQASGQGIFRTNYVEE